MRTVNVHRAQSTGRRDVSPLIIALRDAIPTLPSQGAQRQVQERDARELADALYAHLPGGTLDRLVAYLLDKKASDLLVSMDGSRTVPV